MADLLTGMPFVLVTGDGRRRIAHGRELLTEHRLGEPPAAPAGSGQPGEKDAMWVRLLDESGTLLALAVKRQNVLHPSVVLI